MSAADHEPMPITPRLGLWDAASMVVGIIVGVGIFEAPSRVFSQTSEPIFALSVWLLGGLLALIGAFCFAELASAYPKSGGEYVYLTRAFGPWLGFVYAWTQLTLIRPASIGAVAYIAAVHAAPLLEFGDDALPLIAIGAIAALTAINVLGVTLGKNVQNLLTVLKVLGLVGILAVGFGWGSTSNLLSEGVSKPRWFPSAMIMVLWTYAGWHEAAYIASEVKDSRRNLPLALILGTLLVTGLYLAVNVALVLGLGVSGATNETAAADLAKLAWSGGGEWMSALIVVSALGALNGMIFTTARIAVAFGDDHPFFHPLCRWSRRLNTPARALNIQAIICMILVLGVYLFGSTLSRGQAGAPPQNNPFDDLVYVTGAVFWALFLLTGFALFVLRRNEPEVPRPFRVPGYPFVPVLFCLLCVYMIYGSFTSFPKHSLVGLGITLLGVPLYFVRRLPAKTPSEEKCTVG